MLGLAAFAALVLVPAITAYRRPLERVAAGILSLYVLGALVGIGVVIGAIVICMFLPIFKMSSLIDQH